MKIISNAETNACFLYWQYSKKGGGKWVPKTGETPVTHLPLPLMRILKEYGDITKKGVPARVVSIVIFGQRGQELYRKNYPVPAYGLITQLWGSLRYRRSHTKSGLKLAELLLTSPEEKGFLNGTAFPSQDLQTKAAFAFEDLGPNYDTVEKAINEK